MWAFAASTMRFYAQNDEARVVAAQNIYDDPEFFAGYSALRRAESGLNAALEWPAFRRLLPKLVGLRVLDLGCGMGHFARAAKQLGAAEVLGIDLSERMLDEARSQTSDSSISYVQGDIGDMDFGQSEFDLAACSLAIHYIADYRALVRRVGTALKPGGRFVFSVEHPIMTCIASQSWRRDAAGGKLDWPIDGYRDEGERNTRWFVEGVIKYHRTIETYVNGLLDNGFRLLRLEEPEAEPEFLAERPDLEDARRRPPFLLIAAEREA